LPHCHCNQRLFVCNRKNVSGYCGQRGYVSTNTRNVDVVIGVDKVTKRPGLKKTFTQKNLESANNSRPQPSPQQPSITDPSSPKEVPLLRKRKIKVKVKKTQSKMETLTPQNPVVEGPHQRNTEGHLQKLTSSMTEYCEKELLRRQVHHYLIVCIANNVVNRNRSKGFTDSTPHT
jgi:hypothetical protein